jgi:Yippee zinc-binding/DNA-binding /Mis18, centromere assembly
VTADAQVERNEKRVAMAPLVIIRSGGKQVEYKAPIVRRVHSDAENSLTAIKNGHENEACKCVILHSQSNQDQDEHHHHNSSGDEEDDWTEQVSPFYGLSSELHDLGGMHLFRCAACGNIVADRDDIIAKSFYGKSGKAFLMNSMFNIRTGLPRNRYLLTGVHTIEDVICACCDAILGWKYVCHLCDCLFFFL